MSDMDYEAIAQQLRNCSQIAPGLKKGADAIDQLRAQVAELREVRSLLLAGQGDDDGAQILPDFEDGDSTVAMVEKCAFLLENRRDYIASLKAENERLACLCDIQYAAGVKAGWNYHAAHDHAAMQKCIEMRQRDALPRLKELRMGLNGEGE